VIHSDPNKTFSRDTIRIIYKMVRGNAKAKAQEKNAKKQAEKTSAKSSLGKSNESLVLKCHVCMALMKNAKQMKEHFESKHPKVAMPAECSGGE